MLRNSLHPTEMKVFTFVYSNNIDGILNVISNKEQLYQASMTVIFPNTKIHFY